MKKMRLFFLSFLILAGLPSCKKTENPVYRTLEPLPYLPVYPGSSWVYVSNLGDTSYSSTSANYILNSYKAERGNTDPMYVSFLDGAPIYGYSTPVPEDSHYSEDYEYQQIIFSDELGLSWIPPHDIHFDPPTIQVTAVNQIDTVNGVIYTNVVINTYSFLNQIRTKYHYAKNVGLIKEEGYDQNNNWVTTKALIRYHINH
jgi:hypothetical protein